MKANQQGILEIEDGAFFEDEQTHEIARERCPNISPQKCFGCSEKHHFDFQRETMYARIRMNSRTYFSFYVVYKIDRKKKKAQQYLDAIRSVIMHINVPINKNLKENTQLRKGGK